MESKHLLNLIILISVCTIAFIVCYGFYKDINSKNSEKVKQNKRLKKHKVCILIYNIEHLEKAKKILSKYNEETGLLFNMYSDKTYISFYKTKWYTYPFKLKNQKSVTLGELEEILKDQ